MRGESGLPWRPPHEVITDGVDEILRGGYDLHVHAGPDRHPRRMDVVELVERYRAGGFAGALVKDHFLPTVGRGYVMNRWREDFRCLTSCALNASSGGLNAAHVEAALAEGAQWVFMPTLSAAHFLRYAREVAGASRLAPTSTPALSVLDDRGLVPEVHEVLDVLEGRDVVLGSGHLSPTETRVLFREARRRGISRRVVTHASMDFIDMPVGLQQELVDDGAFIEHCYVSCLWHRPLPLRRIVEQVQAVGADRCFLSSDLGQPENPPPVVGMRAAVGGLRALGVTPKDLRRLVVSTPRRLVESLPTNAGDWHSTN